ncbi:7352_t:CDS:2, partial [Rhizophagus irregularis]
SRRTKFSPILPPLEDQTSWPAPAQVLIKDKEKEMAKINKYSIYRILLNTPLPGHEQSKPSRHHSEDHVGIAERIVGVREETKRLVDDPDKKQSINPKDVAIPESEFKLQSLKPIVLSGIRNVNLIETSDCVFKVGRTIGITKGRIDD